MTNANQQIKPILFSSSMVRAILEGRKTQTRRVVKGMALQWLRDYGFTPEFVAHSENRFCPYGQRGDRLWVRETWDYSPVFYQSEAWDEKFAYRADGAERCSLGRWRPSIHMPRAACRILLEVVDVRVEQLQEIGPDAAVAEGIHWEPGSTAWITMSRSVKTADKYWLDSPNKATWDWKNVYSELWQSIHGPESWAQNPWVWVVEFKRIAP